jgi:hypothetical protein
VLFLPCNRGIFHTGLLVPAVETREVTRIPCFAESRSTQIPVWAKADGAAVILHVQGIARKAERVGEVIDDLGDVVESVCELFWVGPVTVAKAGVIGGDEVIAVGEAREERWQATTKRRKE